MADNIRKMMIEGERVATAAPGVNATTHDDDHEQASHGQHATQDSSDAKKRSRQSVSIRAQRNDNQSARNASRETCEMQPTEKRLRVGDRFTVPADTHPHAVAVVVAAGSTATTRLCGAQGQPYHVRVFTLPSNTAVNRATERHIDDCHVVAM